MIADVWQILPKFGLCTYLKFIFCLISNSKNFSWAIKLLVPVFLSLRWFDLIEIYVGICHRTDTIWPKIINVWAWKCIIKQILHESPCNISPYSPQWNISHNKSAVSHIYHKLNGDSASFMEPSRSVGIFPLGQIIHLHKNCVKTHTHDATSTRCKPLHDILLRSVKY